MKNRLLITTAALLGFMANSISAAILVPNGDFSDGPNGWVNASGAGDTTPFTSPTGGNTGGYGAVTPSGGWGVLVSPTAAGNTGAGYDIATFGLTAGGPVTFRWDSINLGVGNTGPTAGPIGGMKVEAWANNAIVGNTGDRYSPLVGTGATWESYETSWTLPATAQKLIFVPLWAPSANASTIGFDNIGVVPEPSSALLLGLFGLGFLARRTRRN